MASTFNLQDQTLQTFRRVERNIATTFETLVFKLNARKTNFLTRLNKIKEEYLKQQSIRKSNLAQINAHIKHLESNIPTQDDLYTIQQEHIQRSKQLRGQYEHAVQVTTLPVFSAPGIEAITAQLETLGAMEEVSTAYKKKLRPSRRILAEVGKKVVIDRPMGVTLDELNRLYVVNLGNARVQVLQLDGEQVAEFGVRKLSMPHSVAICKQDVFVTDFALKAIIKFRKPDYNIVSSTKEGELERPLGITVNRNYNVFVADSKNNQVVVYDTDLGRIGEFGKEILNMPQDVKMYKDDILVVDQGPRHYLHFFSNTGDPKNSIIRLASGGSWLFLAVDVFGNILVSDYAGKRVEVFAEDDQTIPSIECKYYTTGVAVTGDNQTLVAEFVNSRINFYD